APAWNRRPIQRPRMLTIAAHKTFREPAKRGAHKARPPLLRRGLQKVRTTVPTSGQVLRKHPEGVQSAPKAANEYAVPLASSFVSYLYKMRLRKQPPAQALATGKPAPPGRRRRM